MNYPRTLPILLLASLLGGCGKPQEAGSMEKAAPAPVREERRTPIASTGSTVRTAAGAAEMQLDRALRAMDDFSAALGAQYARFSYDTNRVLTAEHTNFLSRLSDEEFAEFVRDLSLASDQRDISSNEFDLLLGLVTPRLAALARRGEMELYENVARNTLALGLMVPDMRVTGVAENWLNTAWQAAYAQRNARYLVHAVGGSLWIPPGKTAPPGYYEHLLPLYRRIGADETFKVLSETGYVRVQSFVGYLEAELEPERALERYRAIRDDVYRLLRDSDIEQPCAAIDARIEGLTRGLRGKALTDYVCKILEARRKGSP